MIKKQNVLHALHVWDKRMTLQKTVPVRELASLIGLLNSTRLQYNRASLYLVKMNRVKCGCVAREGWEGKCVVTHMLSGELAWWQKIIADNVPASLWRLPLPEAHLFVDASPSGWGAWLHQDDGRYHAFGTWPVTVQNQTSNFREMLAVSTAIKSYLSRMILHSGIHLRIHSDNTSVVFNIQRRAAAKNLYHSLRDLFNICAKSDIIITAQHVKGVNNGVADSLSRLSRSGDYSICPGVFENICEQLQITPDVDLFATSENTQLPKYFSPLLSDNTDVRDALSIPWDGMLPLVHPPIPLIGKCLRKILAENCTAVFVLPFWKGQSWNSLLGSMIKRTFVIGKSEEVLKAGKIMNAKGDKLPPGVMVAHLLEPPYIF
jgi:ribonuclease HI